MARRAVYWTNSFNRASPFRGLASNLVVTQLAFSLTSFLLQACQQLFERLYELLHPLVLQLLSEVVDIDAEFGKKEKDILGLLEPLFKPCFRLAVIAVGVERFPGDRIDRFRSDQCLDILDVAVLGILRAGAGPKNALGSGVVVGELAEPIGLKRLLIDLVGQFGAGDRDLPVQRAGERSHCFARHQSALRVAGRRGHRSG